ncbi:DoxX family membrane protein [Acinetobacter pittii]|uniref:DoxX family membrane protein n=1 Tax=Acinetobacter calcoaceticus/baumannii complex TaxID=909768 RepID=UPI003AF262C6
MIDTYGLFNFNEIEKEMIEVKRPNPKLFAVVTILCHLIESALVIFNPLGYRWVGASGLIIFNLLIIPFGHAF